MDPSETYREPTALVAISSISIGIAVIASSWISLDIVRRRGWKSMMFIMIPVYVINALYLWPITLWVYLKYGRPTKPSIDELGKSSPHNAHHPPHASGGAEMEQHAHSTVEAETSRSTMENEKKPEKDDGEIEKGGPQKLQEQAHNASVANHHQHDHSNPEGSSHAHRHYERPMFATVTVGVCHCGAGCVLGDIVGEWLVYGTNATIGSPARLLWTAYLVDFGFAFAFGIVFQYFSIAPMAGDYSPKVLYRALKADALSLIFFQIGLFGWMAIYQISIFDWRLKTDTVTYWWMMQIGMFIGHWTSVPINWWLINTGVKMPCA